MGARVFLKRKVVDFNVFFCFLTNSVLVNKGVGWVEHLLPTETFCLTELGCTSNLVIKFFNKPRSLWLLFWKIVKLNSTMGSGFFMEMGLFGLGFRIRKITSVIYRFFWGQANYVYLFVPANVLVEYAADGKGIFFFSLNILELNNFVSYLMLLKKLSAYRVTGFVQPGKIIRTNSGKQR
jgi:hypothetical protein